MTHVYQTWRQKQRAQSEAGFFSMNIDTYFNSNYNKYMYNGKDELKDIPETLPREQVERGTRLSVGNQGLKEGEKEVP